MELMILSGANPINFTHSELEEIIQADWYLHYETNMILIDTENLDVDGGLMEIEFTELEDAGIDKNPNEDDLGYIGLPLKRISELDGFYSA